MADNYSSYHVIWQYVRQLQQLSYNVATCQTATAVII
jgi:hypothetical protein